MSSERLESIRIEDSSIEIIDGDRGKNYPKQDEFSDNGYCLFLNAGNVTASGFDFQQLQFVSQEKDLQLRKGKLTRNDIVLTTRGTVGNVGYYDESIPYENMRINSGMVIFRMPKPPSEFDTGYFYHFLRSNLFKAQVLSHSSGSAQPQLPIKDLRQISVACPPLPTQRRIADILSALDDKIELNRQTNATLEALAQAIFQEWFVKFNYPGSTALTTSGATGEMVESELGLIPVGWRVGKLGDFCRNKRQTVNPNEVLPETAYVGLEHITRRSLGLTSWGAAEDVDSQKSSFQKFDILFGKLRPYFHKVCIAPVDGICSTDILVTKPINPDLFSFCLNYLFSNEMIAYVSVIADGTRMPRVDWGSIGDFEIVIPHESLLSDFNQIVFPFYEEIVEINHQSAILAQTRDTLLPKLMRGEIEV